MIDVYKEIKDMLVFDSEDDYYYLQILQRKKENPSIGANSIVVKNYQIPSIAFLDKNYEQIKTLCDVFNARAMLRLNRRSYRKTAFKTLENIANTMGNGEYRTIRNTYDRASGSGNNETVKKWIIDLDGIISDDVLLDMKEIINYGRPNDTAILKTLETKNGIHLICRPFDTRLFVEKYGNIDIHKDNPINLYIP